MGGMILARPHARPPARPHAIFLVFLAMPVACSDHGTAETRGTTRAVEQLPDGPLPSEPRWTDVVAGDGYAVPPGGRRVVLASYFSVDTQMR